MEQLLIEESNDLATMLAAAPASRRGRVSRSVTGIPHMSPGVSILRCAHERASDQLATTHMPVPIAAVLFDLDDTILDRRTTLDRYLVNLPSRGLVPPAMAEKFRARFHELDECGYSDRRSMFRQLVAEFADLGPPDALRDDYRTHAWSTSVLADGASDVLAWCRRSDIRLGIVTNGSSKVQRAKLDALRLWDLVDVVAIADEEGVAKPAAEAFHRTAARLGVTAAACLVVGDSPQADIVGARNAGMRHVWVRAGLPWPPDVEVPSHSLAQLNALPDLIIRLGQ